MKILFATDGSSSALKAAQFLARIEFASPYELVIATVSYDPTISAHEQFSWADEWHDHESGRVEEAQNEIETALEGKFENVKRVHRVGPPHRELLQIAQQENVDLIVLGAVGHSMIRRVLLGSVSDHIATHAECSVLVVRLHEFESDEPLKRIMLAHDGSEPSLGIVDEIRSFGFSQDVDLSVTTALHRYGYLTSVPNAELVIERQREWFAAQTSNNLDLVSKLTEDFPNAHSVIEECQYPNEALVQSAETNDVQLILVGDSGHTFWEDLMLGSTTKYMLRHASSSVWISRYYRNHAQESIEAKPEALEQQ